MPRFHDNAQGLFSNFLEFYYKRKTAAFIAFASDPGQILPHRCRYAAIFIIRAQCEQMPVDLGEVWLCATLGTPNHVSYFCSSKFPDEVGRKVGYPTYAKTKLDGLQAGMTQIGVHVAVLPRLAPASLAG